MASNIFGDNPPQEFARSAKGWLKRKPSGTSRRISKLKSENDELKQRLEQLEAAVEQIVSKKKK
jgi:hypothetical protein